MKLAQQDPGVWDVDVRCGDVWDGTDVLVRWSVINLEWMDDGMKDYSVLRKGAAHFGNKVRYCSAFIYEVLPHQNAGISLICQCRFFFASSCFLFFLYCMRIGCQERRDEA